MCDPIKEITEGVGGGDFWQPVNQVLQVVAPAVMGAVMGPALAGGVGSMLAGETAAGAGTFLGESAGSMVVPMAESAAGGALGLESSAFPAAATFLGESAGPMVQAVAEDAAGGSLYEGGSAFPTTMYEAMPPSTLADISGIPGQDSLYSGVSPSTLAEISGTGSPAYETMWTPSFTDALRGLQAASALKNLMSTGASTPSSGYGTYTPTSAPPAGPATGAGPARSELPSAAYGGDAPGSGAQLGELGKQGIPEYLAQNPSPLDQSISSARQFLG